MNRAQLASVYAGVLGAELAVGDLLEHIQIAAGAGKLGLDEIAFALNGMGLSAQVGKLTKPAPDHWPALAEMTSGHIVLVLSQTEDGFDLYDPSVPDARAEVPMADFLSVYAGRILRARTTMAELEARHSVKQGSHWFWGNSPNTAAP